MSHLMFGYATALIGSLAVTAFGIFALLVRPRRPETTWFGLFGVGFGGVFTMNTIMATLLFDHATGTSTPQNSWLFFAPQIPFAALVVVATIGLARVFPKRLGRGDARFVALAALIASVIAVTEFAATFNPPAGSISARTDGQPYRLLWQVFFALRPPVAFGYLFLLIFEYRSTTDPALRRLTALTAAAFTFQLGYNAGYGRFTNGPYSIVNAEGTLLIAASAYFLAAILAAALWLASMRGPDRRLARNMAWLTLGMVLAGLSHQVVSPGSALGGGIARLLMTATLAYAVVKHHFLGIDVKVRWTISKGTVAATFVAVFFVASELAQQFFGDALGGPYVGIIAAGGLVFAIAPLSRIADRIAIKAVPVATSPPAPADAARAFAKEERIYKSALRAVLRDRILTHNEEHELAEIATELGIDPRHALQWRDEVWAQIAGKGAAHRSTSSP